MALHKAQRMKIRIGHMIVVLNKVLKGAILLYIILLLMKPQTHPCDDVVCYPILMVSVTCQKSDKGAALLVCYETRIPCGWDSAAISDFELLVRESAPVSACMSEHG